MLTKNQVVKICKAVLFVLENDQEAESQPEKGQGPTVGAPAASNEPPKPRGRSRKAAEPEAPPANNTTGAETTQPPAAPEPPKPEPVPAIKGKTIEELRKMFEPLVKANRGAEVQEVLNKYKPADWPGQYTTSALADHPEHHAAFEKDIQTLLI